MSPVSFNLHTFHQDLGTIVKMASHHIVVVIDDQFRRNTIGGMVKAVVNIGFRVNRKSVDHITTQLVAPLHAIVDYFTVLLHLINTIDTIPFLKNVANLDKKFGLQARQAHFFTNCIILIFSMNWRFMDSLEEKKPFFLPEKAVLSMRKSRSFWELALGSV